MFYSLQKPNTLFLCCSSSVVVCKSVHGLLRLGKCVPDFMPEMVFLAQKWRRLYVFLLACRDINGVVIYAIGVRNALGTGSASRTHTCQLSNQIRPHCKTSFHLFWPMFCLLLSCLPWRHVGARRAPSFLGKRCFLQFIEQLLWPRPTTFDHIIPFEALLIHSRMASVVPFPQAEVDATQDAFNVFRRYVIAVYAVLVWDWLICLRDEYRLIWKAPWSLTKVNTHLLRPVPLAHLGYAGRLSRCQISYACHQDCFLLFPIPGFLVGHNNPLLTPADPFVQDTRPMRSSIQMYAVSKQTVHRC